MDVETLISNFMASGHGQAALSALTSQGHAENDAQGYLGHGVAAAHDHVHDHADQGGILGAHPGRSFFAAFAAGLVRGDSVVQALEDGAAGVVTAKITEVLCDRAGLDANTASTIAATATPYLLGFLREHLGH
ncbi:MAG: hypothetical protein U0235_07990 [Polyangiaceae bacterium]